MNARWAAITVLGAFSLWGTSFSGCFAGGANFHQQAPGNNDTGGIDLEGGDAWREDPNDPDEVAKQHFGAIAVAPIVRNVRATSPRSRLACGDRSSGRLPRYVYGFVFSTTV